QATYDGFGHLRRTVAPGEDTTVDYFSSGPDLGGLIPIFPRTRIESTTLNGPHLIEDRDAFGRVVRTISTGLAGKDVISEAEYDVRDEVRRRSRPHLVGDASQGIDVFFYENRGRLDTVKRADGSTTTYSYAT